MTSCSVANSPSDHIGRWHEPLPVDAGCTEPFVKSPLSHFVPRLDPHQSHPELRCSSGWIGGHTDLDLTSPNPRVDVLVGQNRGHREKAHLFHAAIIRGVIRCANSGARVVTAQLSSMNTYGHARTSDTMTDVTSLGVDSLGTTDVLTVPQEPT